MGDHKKFRKIRTYNAIKNGRKTTVAVFERGRLRVEVNLNEIDHVEALTTSPKKWLESKIVFPTGQSDSSGKPIYAVVRPRKTFSRINR